MTRTSSIVEIDEDIQLSPEEIESAGMIIGALVTIQKNSGLIKRCEHCNRVLTKGVCPIHGKVKGYDDLRVKGVLDDGENFYWIVLSEKNIKSLTGIDVEEAKRIAMENLDKNAVLEELKSRLLGRYFKVKGFMIRNNLIVSEIEFYKPKIEDFKKVLEVLS